MSRLLSVILAIVLCLISGTALGASIDLRSDSRLAARLTLHEPMIPVRRLLARVQSECKLPLEAKPEIRDETVCVCVQDQTCAEVLDQVARALDYRWTTVRDRSGSPVYRLIEDESTRASRHTLARRFRREVGGELSAQLTVLDRFAGQLGGADPKVAQDELDRLQLRVIGLPVGRERLQAEIEESAARVAVDPRSRPLLLALAALPPQARDRLVDGERLVMAVRRPGAIPMPERVVQALRAARQAQAGERSAGGTGAPAPQTDDEIIDFLSQVAWGELTVYVRARWLPGQPERLKFAVPTFLQTPSLVAHGPVSLDLRAGLVTADRPADLRAPITFTRPLKRLRAEQPLTYHTGFTVAEVLAHLAARDPRWQISGSALFEGIRPGPLRAGGGGDLLSGSEAAGALLERLAAKGRTGSLTLGELLEPLSERGGVNIHVTHPGWIRFHSTRPFRARERQVDPAVLQEVFGPVLEASDLTPEAAMAAGRLLSRGQMETLSAPHLGFPRHLTQNSGLRHGIDAWRLLDRLAPLHRQALLAGATLRYSSLNESGRKALRDYLRSISEYPNGAPLDLEVGARALPQLRLSLTPGDAFKRILELRVGEAFPPLYIARLEATWLSSAGAPARSLVR